MNSESEIKPKRIHVFVNGNPTERIFFVHPKCRLSWTSIINFIGDLLKPPNGGIRTLRRVDGHPVSSYEELEENGKYVACGKEPLVPLLEGYRTDSEIEIQKELREKSSSEIITAVGGNIKYLTDTNQMSIITIYVFINGQKTKPNKISLLYTDLGHWGTILSVISKQIKMSIKYLFTIFGERLKVPSEIQHRGFYVGLDEGSSFNYISYLSVFSPKRQRKVRFKQTTQQTVLSESPIFNEDVLVSDAVSKSRTTPPTSIDSNESSQSIKEVAQVMPNWEVINLNDPTSDSPCIHVTIVQRPFTATKHSPGIPATVCATKPSAKLVLEMMGEHETKCHFCKSTQTTNIFCEAVPKGKCVIEVASKKFHIICDDDAIVLPCGTYFSSHKSMKNPCIFPLGNESLSLENIANHIVGIVVDTSEYCVARAIYGLDKPMFTDLDTKEQKAEEKKVETTKDDSPKEVLRNIIEGVLQEPEVTTQS